LLAIRVGVPPAPEPVTKIVRESAKPAVPAVNDPTNEEVIVTEAVSPIATDALAAESVRVSSVALIAAEEGATERTPRPNAATATSAIRLKVVFVDICFLSVVDIETFPISALR
jgi:hypothetical protein